MDTVESTTKIFKKLPIGTIIYNKYGDITDINESAKELMGIPPDIKINISLFENPDINIRKNELMTNKIVRFEAPFYFDYLEKTGLYKPTKKGMIYIDYTVSVTDFGFLLQMQDVTKQRKLEAVLIRQANLIDMSHDAIVVGQFNGVIESWNKGAEELYGYYESEAIGKKIQELLCTDYPSPWKEIESKLADGGIWEGELKHNNKEGNELTVLSRIQVIKNIGESDRLLEINRDITERKKGEKKLKIISERFYNILSNLSESILLVSQEGKVEFVNPSFIKFFNLIESIDELDGLSSPDMIAKIKGTYKYPDKEVKRINEIVKDGKPVFNEEISIKNGRTWIRDFIPIFIDNEFYGRMWVHINITDRKKAEEALRESEEKYRNIIDNIQDAYMRSSNEGVITMASLSAARMYGFNSPKEMIGVPNTALYKNPDERLPLLEKLKKNGKLLDYECVGLKRDGRSFPVSMNVQFHYNKNGQIQGTETFIRDITELKEREMLSDSLNKINTYINSTLDYDEIMQLIVKEGAKALRAESSVINLKESDNWVVKFVYNFPDNIVGQIKTDQESPTSIFVANKRRAIAFNDAHNDSRVNKNGMKLYGVKSLLVTPIIIKDDVKGVIAFYHHKKQVFFTDEQIDFSNKLASSLSQAIENAQLFENVKRSEEKFSKAFHSNSAAMTVTRISDGKIIDANESFEHLFGYTHEETVGHTTNELGIWLTSEERNAEVEVLLRDGKIPMHEVIFGTKSGSHIHTMFSVELITINNQDCILSTVMDITGRKQAEEKLQKLLKSEQKLTEDLQLSNEELLQIQNELNDYVQKLEISNKELEQFAYVASHDLQEPLRMVGSFSQLLEKRYKNKLDADADDYIDFIVEGAHRMKDLIDDLLSFSRLSTQKNEFHITDLNQVFDAVLLNLKSAIEEEDAHITKDNLPIVNCDSTQISQVLQNLISNSIKFHQTPPKIHISAEEKDREWILGVSDEGIGIDPEHHQKIFDVFRRLHTREEYAGTGIGLSICKRIIERHKGRIWVESDPGKGANFYFTIPKSEMDVYPK